MEIAKELKKIGSRIFLEFPCQIKGISKFGKHFFFLDESLKLHETDLAFNKEKSLALIETELIKEQVLLLKNGSICYIKDGLINIFSIKTKTNKSLYWFGEHITSICQSSSGDMIAVGYSDGKVNVFLTEGDIYQSLSYEIGGITTLEFSTKDNRLIISGDKSKTIVHDVDLNRTVSSVTTKSNVIKALFLDESKIFAIVNSGYTCILDTKNNNIESLSGSNIQNPVSLSLSPDGHYAMVGTKDGKIVAIAAHKNKIMFADEFSSDAISDIKWIDETLFILYANKSVEIFPVYIEHQNIREKIFEKKYNEASLILKENRFLSLFSDIEEELDDAWENEILPNFIDMLIDGRKEDAAVLAESFFVREQQRNIFNQYLERDDVVRTFFTACQEQFYANIYLMVENFPYLKKSYKYKKIEEVWELSYRKALDMIKIGQNEQARDILIPFKDVRSKKNIISALMNFPKIFIDAENLYSNGKINEYFAYVAKNPILKETQEYISAINEAEDLLVKINEAIKNNDYRYAITLARVLENSEPYKTQAKKIIDPLKNKVMFINLMGKNDIDSAFKIAQEDCEVTKISEFKELFSYYLGFEKTAYGFALEGKTSQAIEVLSEFIEIPLLRDKIASIIKIAYLKSFLQIQNAQDVDWKATINNYSDYFGLDLDLKMALQKAGLDKEFIGKLGFVDKLGYRKYKFTNEVIKYKTQEQIGEEKKIHLSPSFKNYFYIIAALIVFIVAANLVIYMFSGKISEYKEERKSSPFGFFEKITK